MRRVARSRNAEKIAAASPTSAQISKAPALGLTMNKVPRRPTPIAAPASPARHGLRRQKAASAVNISGEVSTTADNSAIFMCTRAATKNAVASASNRARHSTFGIEGRDQAAQIDDDHQRHGQHQHGQHAAQENHLAERQFARDQLHEGVVDRIGRHPERQRRSCRAGWRPGLRRHVVSLIAAALEDRRLRFWSATR